MSIILFKRVKLIDLRKHGVRNTTQCKYLLEVLADYAQEKRGNFCIPNQETIANRMNAHPKTVHRWARELAKAKIIFIEHRIGTSNSYVFNGEIFEDEVDMNTTQSNPTPTACSMTQDNPGSNIAPYPEQPRSDPASNNTPLTLIDLDNTYFQTLKKTDHGKYLREISVIGKKIGFNHQMPEGELELGIKKYFAKPKTEEQKEQEKQEALKALRNFNFKRLR